jgi:hypothetical protein
MKKIIIGCLLATSGASALAEWTPYFLLGDVVFSIDHETIRRDGSMRKVWQIHDYKQLGKYGEMSVRMRTEYDCQAERHRVLSISLHSENMASGETLKSTSHVGLWLDIPPGSAAEVALKIVCAK